jgi:hypothetical protein
LINRGGPLLIVEQFERNGNSKDDLKSGGYFSDDELLGTGLGALNSATLGAATFGINGERLAIAEKPVFKIKFKPRQSCNLHQEVLNKQQVISQ